MRGGGGGGGVPTPFSLTERSCSSVPNGMGHVYDFMFSKCKTCLLFGKI